MDLDADRGPAAARQDVLRPGQLVLYAALDPWVDITLIDGKSSPDWLPLRYVAHRFIQGTYPTRDGNPAQRALEALRAWIDRHIEHVNDELKKLPVSECPQGKLTEKLYRRPDLHVQLLIMEEFQCYFELDDQRLNKEFANLLSRIGAMGPSVGVILMSAVRRSRQVSAPAMCSGCSTVSGITTRSGSGCGAPTGTCPTPSSGTRRTARGMTARACRWATSSRASASCTA